MKFFVPVLLFGTIASMSHGMQLIKQEVKKIPQIQCKNIDGLHRVPVKVKSYLNLPPAVIQGALTPDSNNTYDFTKFEQFWHGMAQPSQHLICTKTNIVKGGLHRDGRMTTVISHFHLPPTLMQKVLTPDNTDCCTTYDLTALERYYSSCYLVNRVRALQVLQSKLE